MNSDAALPAGDAPWHGSRERGSQTGQAGGLVGRAAELASLTRALDGLADGSARCVGLFGEPGIGKTRLLRELAARARRQQRPVLWGAATEFERHVPFGLFTNALEDHLDTLDEPKLAALGADRVGLLRSVFPALPALEGAAGVADAERYLLHRALRALLELLAQPDGLVLILDDAHWADDGSAELLDHLLRHPPRGPLLLVVAYRPRQLPPRLGSAFPAAVRRGNAEHLEVGPLSPSEAKDLLAARGSSAGAPELYKASGGNPFYLEALARGGNTGNSPAATWDADDIAPPVRAALLAELAALADGHRLVADSAAVAGELCDAGTVADIAGLQLPEVIDALDALAARDLIRPAGVAGRFEFRHPLVRHVTYQAAGAGWRVTAHARAASALSAQGVSAAGRAHHVERSAGLGDLDAVAVLTEAATASLHSTPATAAHWLGAALRLLPDDEASTVQRLGLLGMRARALGTCGRLQESRDVMREVVGLLPAEPAEQRAQVVAFCALMERLLGHHDEARSLLLSELAKLTERTGPAAALLSLELAAGHLMRADFDAALDWSIQTIQIARQTTDRPLLARSLATCVLTSFSANKLDERVWAWLDESAQLFDAMPDAELGRLLETAATLGLAEVNLVRYRPAMRHLKRGLTVARATGQNHLIPYLLLALASVQGGLGHLADAAASTEDALEAALLTGSDELRQIALSHQCWLHTLRGDLPAALRFGEEALAGGLGDKGWFSAYAHFALAYARLFSGDVDGCEELLFAVGGGPELTGLDRSAYPSTYQLLAAVAAARGNHDEAVRWATRSEASAAELDLARLTAFSDLAWAYALQSTDPAESAARAQAAAGTFEQAGLRPESGRAHLLTGIAFSALGEQDRARAEFARTRAIAEECGALLFRDQAIREERRMNARRPRKPSAVDTDVLPGEPASLTQREREVAELVARGMTNRQIAETLFLSPKTVEVHVSRAFAKLGVSTRAALAFRWRKQAAGPGS